MIIQKRRPDGLISTKSNQNFYIIQNETGRKYAEAVDKRPLKYTYSESDEKIKNEDLINS